ncbi:unnamed protein product [Protopolystoma xenopodis]|uniref:Anoctamin n=1 Tax=Protopolystoma xenopodis TaxID=117903 RepID=A0A3S5C4S8_9PLAT|nr:unnamed protein product [Protopolystoma xenopodis]
MCPLCSVRLGCDYWQLSDICFYIKVSYLFDHPGTVFFAIFMVIWGRVIELDIWTIEISQETCSVTFLECWKRKSAELAHHWDVLDYENEEERPRPQYAALCSTYAKNPVTGLMEPYFPQKYRIPRLITGIGCILIMARNVFKSAME